MKRGGRPERGGNLYAMLVRLVFRAGGHGMLARMIGPSCRIRRSVPWHLRVVPRLRVQNSLSKKNGLSRKIPPLTDYKEGRSGIGVPFPTLAIQAEEKKHGHFREMGVDVRCQMRYDVPRPTPCVTASPSITRNLENFTIRTALPRVRSAHAPFRVS